MQTMEEMLAEYRDLQQASRVPPLAFEVKVLEGVTGSPLLYDPVFSVSPRAHPALEKLLNDAGAVRRGIATWSVGRGELTDQYPMAALFASVESGMVIDAAFLQNVDRSPRDIRSRGTRSGLSYFTAAALRHEWPTRYDTRSNPYLRDGVAGTSCGIVGVKVSDGSQFISVHTTHRLAPLEKEFADADTHQQDTIVQLNTWLPGRTRKAPRLYRASQMLEIIAALDAHEIPLLDSCPEGLLAQVRDDVDRSVIAWTRPGRPAEARISIGGSVSPVAGSIAQMPGGGTRRGNTTVRTVAALNAIPLVQLHAHPAVLDVMQLHNAAPLADERLFTPQKIAAGRHLATKVGYVNCSPTGEGKTVMVLSALRHRAMQLRQYRALVLVENTMMSKQWAEEAAVWFPRATVVRVASSKDAAKLVEVLREAGDFPVVVLTSYHLASLVVDALEAKGNAQEFLEDGADAKAPILEEAVAQAPAEPTPAAAEFTGTTLLDLLDMIEKSAPQPEPEPEALEPEEPEGAQIIEPLLGEVLAVQHWDDLIADEARIARGGRRASALWHLRSNAGVAVALTATPAPKGLDDLGTLIEWARGDRTLFSGHRLSVTCDLGSEAGMAQFADIVGPTVFVTAPTMQFDVRPTLMVLEPTAAERQLAAAAEHELRQVYLELCKLADAIAAAQDDGDTEELARIQAAQQAARGAWLGGTTLARMAASDPAVLLSAESNGARLLASQGLVAAATAQPGTKRTAVVTDVLARLESGEKVLIFTDFATVAGGLFDDLYAAGARVGLVAGAGGRSRTQTVEDFQDGLLDVLVCTKSGERGLNLQRATTLVHYDLPWTADRLVQRTGRLTRIGSLNPTIHLVFPLMAGTIEERVARVVVTRGLESLLLTRALDTTGTAVRAGEDVLRSVQCLFGAAGVSEDLPEKTASMMDIARFVLAESASA